MLVRDKVLFLDRFSKSLYILNTAPVALLMRIISLSIEIPVVSSKIFIFTWAFLTTLYTLDRADQCAIFQAHVL